MIAEPRTPGALSLVLSPAELDELIDVAHHYENVLGVVRHVVIAISPRAVKRRYRYIVRESADLERRAQAWRSGINAGNQPLEMTVFEAVSFWGRLLSNLRTKRSRRRLSTSRLQTQEELVERIASVVKSLFKDDQGLVESEIQTRRRREREWMMTLLTGEDVVH